MAETHVINIVARFTDEASKKLNATRASVSRLGEDFKRGLGPIRESQKAIDDLRKAHTDYQHDLKTEINVLKDNIEQRKKYQKMVKDQVAFERELTDVQNKLLSKQNALSASIKESSTIQDRHVTTVEKAGVVYETLSNSISKVRREAENNNTTFGKFARTFREFDKDGQKLTNTLQRTFFALRGLAVGSVIIFMNALISSFVALAGQAVALVGSLGLVATTLVGTLVPAIAQAIPAIGLLVAAFSRLSVIQQAVQAQDNIREQRANTQLQQSEARREAANRIADAERGVADAGREVVDAEEAVGEAQADVTEAREEATRQLEDLILAEKEAKLAAQDSVLSLREARNQLQDLIAEGASPDEIARARLQVKEAQLDQERSQTELTRATEDANEAQAKGIEGSDLVVDAKKRLADANEAVASAERGVADATRSLAEAQREAKNVTEDQTAAQQQLNFLLDQLSPAERKLFDAVTRMRRRLSEAFRPITDIIIRSFTRGIGRVEKLLLDEGILRGFKKLAGGIADSLDEITKVFTNRDSIEFWELMLSESRKNLKPLTDILINLAELFKNIAEGAAPVLSKLLKLLADETGRWADETEKTSAVTEFFETGLKHIKAWAGLLGAVVELFHELALVAGPSALDTIGRLTGTVEGASEGIRNNQKETRDFFNETAEATADLGRVIVAIGEALVEIFNTGSVEAFADILVELLIPAFRDAVIIVGAAVTVLEKFINLPIIGELIQWSITALIAFNSLKLLYAIIAGPLIRVLGLFSTGLVIVTNFIIGTIKALGALGVTLKGVATRAGIIGVVITALILLSEAWAKVGDDVRAFINKIKNGFSDVTNFVRDKLGIIGKLGTDVVHIILSPIRGLATTFSNAFEGVMKIVHGFVHGDFGEVWDGLKQLITAPIKGALAVLETLIQPFKDVGSAIGGAFADAFTFAFETAKDFVVGAFDFMLGAITTLLGALENLPFVGGDLEAVKDDINAFREDLNREPLVLDSDQTATIKNLDKSRAALADLGDETEKTTKKTKNQGNELKKTNKELDDNADKSKKAKDGQEDLGKDTKKTTDRIEDQRGGLKKLFRGLGVIGESLFGTGKQSRELGRVIKEVTNKVLKSFNVKELSFDLPSVGKVLGNIVGSFAGSFAGGGWIGRQGEIGPDDRFIKVAGGEAIANHWQQGPINKALGFGKAMGVVPYGNLNELFKGEQRPHYLGSFAKGGGTGPIPGQTAGLQPAIMNLLNKLFARFGGSVTSGVRPYDSDSFHSQGIAADYAPGDWKGASAAVNKLGPRLREGIYNPAWYGGTPVSWNEGQQITYDAGTWADHRDHIHIAISQAAGKVIGGLAEQLKKINVRGPKGPLKDMLQGQADRLRKAANKFIEKKTRSKGFTGDINTKSGEGFLSPAQFLALAAKAIKFTNTQGQFSAQGLLDLAQQESSLEIRSINNWDSNAAAGNPSGGLMHLTQSNMKYYGSPSRGGAGTNMFNPFSSIVASILYQLDRYGHQVTHSPYGLGGFVTAGFPSFGDGGVVPGPLGSPRMVQAHGGELILPTHKFNQGGFAIGGSVKPEIGEIMTGIKTATDDVEGVNSFLKAIEDIIREGGFLDKLAELITTYETELTRRLNLWALQVRKGTVAQIKSAVQIANRELENLEKIGRLLAKELEEVSKLLRAAERKLKKAEDKEERQKLKAAINSLEKRQAELADAMAQNLQDRLAAQQAALDAVFARFDQKKSKLDTQAQIIAARGELSGDTNVGGQVSVLQDIGKVLSQERKEIERQLRRARRTGDVERQRELEQALKDNTLATLENSIAIRDVLLESFQKALEELGTQLAGIDLKQQIAEALGELAGTGVDIGTAQNLIEQQQANLDQQAFVLQGQLAKAQATGNTTAIAETQNAILENTLAQIATEQALKDLKFEALNRIIEQLNTRLGQLDIRRQIVEAVSNLTGGGTINQAAIQALLENQREALEQQRVLLQAQLAKAQSIGDPTLIAEFSTALLENQLAIHENTQAIKDLQLAVFEQQLDRLSSALQRLDLRQQIVEATSQLAGTGTEGNAIRELLRLQQTNLEQQRAVLQNQLAKAKMTGDITLINETNEALLQNQLELINLQQALKDLDIQLFNEAMDRLQSLVGQFDIRRQILELQAKLTGISTTAEQIALVQQTIDNLAQQRLLLEQELAEAIDAGDSARVEELTTALLENELATLQNTETLQTLEGTLGEVISFNSTAWQIWRRAIFNGLGGVIPTMPIPSLATGGQIISSGMINIHAGETVVPAKVNQNVQKKFTPIGDTIINITEPMEVADPVALSNAIGMKLKTNKAVNR